MKSTRLAPLGMIETIVAALHTIQFRTASSIRRAVALDWDPGDALDFDISQVLERLKVLGIVQKVDVGNPEEPQWSLTAPIRIGLR